MHKSEYTQKVFSSSKSATETQEQGVQFVQEMFINMRQFLATLWTFVTFVT